LKHRKRNRSKISNVGEYILRLLHNGALHRDDIKTKVRKEFPHLGNPDIRVGVELRRLGKSSKVEKLGHGIHGLSKGLGIEAKLEKVPMENLYDDEIRTDLKQILKGKGGIYALYDKEGKLVYIGIAKGLLGRLGDHSKDRLADKWSKMSLYVTPSKESAKSIEALFLRIYKPKYNKNIGRLGKKVANIGKEVASKHEQIAKKFRKM
jgi:hypothetical protein